jgi:hypothetical protein
MAEHCPHCGRNLALVGRIHHCEPRREKLVAAIGKANAKTEPGMVKVGLADEARQHITSIDPERQAALNANAKAGLDVIASKSMRGVIDKAASVAICGVDLAKAGSDQTVGAMVHMEGDDVKFTPVSVDDLLAVAKKPKRDRAAYMRDYRANQKAQGKS